MLSRKVDLEKLEEPEKVVGPAYTSRYCTLPRYLFVMVTCPDVFFHGFDPAYNGFDRVFLVVKLD
jgi:hypothetical protein